MKRKIRIDYTKCTGCELCEFACSLHHTGAVNPSRSRIRVYIEENFCLPVIAGSHVDAACQAKAVIVFNGKELSQCVICQASCPQKSVFKEPGTHIPLECDLCTQCVRWCPTEALTLVPQTHAEATR